MTTKKRGAAPMTKLTQAIFAAVGQRAQHASNLWMVYSPRNDRQWILRSDTEFLHFHAVEFAPEVDHFDLAPLPVIVTVDEESRQTTFDAVVRFRDGHTECREIKRTAAAAAEPEIALRELMQRESQQRAAGTLGGTYALVTESDLERFSQRIINSLRMTRFLTATRHFSLANDRNGVLIELSCKGPQSLGSLLSSRPEHTHAHVLSATFSLLQRRKLVLEPGMDAAAVTLDTVARLPS